MIVISLNAEPFVGKLISLNQVRQKRQGIKFEAIHRIKFKDIDK